MVQLTKPEAGNTIYDPAAGSGGFLIQAHRVREEQGGNADDPALYGQDSNGTTWSHPNRSRVRPPGRPALPSGSRIRPGERVRSAVR